MIDQQGAYGKASGPRASFWQRFGAGFIDGIIVSIIPGLIGLVTHSQNTYQGLAAIVGLAYTTYLEGGPSGQSLGKKAMNIRVVDTQTGGSIGYGRGFLRWLGAIVSGIPCGLGYLWMLWDGEKQTWHDKISSSYVVPVSAYPVN